MNKKGITLEQKLEAYKKAGTIRGAARLLNLDPSAVRSSLISAGLLNDTIPITQKIKGVSTLYNNKGEAVSQWVKTNEDAERTLGVLREACDALKEEIKPFKPNKNKVITNNDLLSCYVLTDYHLGQLSWEDETGQRWDTEIAKNMLINWFSKAIESAPASHTGVLLQLGDFLHYDSIVSITPTSGHVLDADSRYAQIVNIAIKAFVQIVDMMLEKHQHVHIVMAEGNHDISSSVWLRALFSEKYSKEPRVTVDNSHKPYYCKEWGKTSLFFHHGHKKNFGQIAESFAGMFRDVFGRTKYSYAHMGHMHHVASKENGLMIVEQHPTLAAPDAHSTRGGYVSNRGASVITYHKEYGEVSRSTIRPEMLK